MTSPTKSLLFAALSIALCLPCSLMGETELLPDDLESDGGVSWKSKTDGRGGVNISVETVDQEPALSVAVDVSDFDGEPPDIRIQRVFGTLDNTRAHRITFAVKAQEPTMIIAFAAPESAGHMIAWRVEIPVTNEWTEHRFEFKPNDAADDVVLGFAHLGKQTNTFWFKNVTVTSD